MSLFSWLHFVFFDEEVMEPQQSTDWLDGVCADDDSPQLVLDALGLRNQEQRDEIETVMCVYSAESKVQLARDRFQRVMLRCTVCVDVCKSVLQAVVTLVVPVLYPLPGHPLQVRITSKSGSKDFVSSLTKLLTDDASEFAALGMPAMMMLFGKAAENIQNMPKAMWSSDYCCCVTCNARKLKNGEEKSPQPALRSDEGDWRCLVCGSVGMHIPSVRAYAAEEVDDHPCTMCFCGDICMVNLTCGDVVCFSCFVRMCELAIGAKDLVASSGSARLPSLRPAKHQCGPSPLVRSFFGVQCPNHKKQAGAVIYDPALIKLLPTRSYNRFNFFALEKSLKGYHCVVFCPLPACCGYCFISNQYGRFCICPFCGDTFCAKCSQPYLGCTCKDTESLEREIWEMDQKSVAVVLGLTNLNAEPQAPPRPEVRGAVTTQKDELFTILLTVRNIQATLQIPSAGWFSFIQQQLQDDLVPYPSTHRKRIDEVFAAVFHGYVLDPSRSLREQLVYTGAIVFVVEYFPFDSYCRDVVLTKLVEHGLQKHTGLVDVHKKKCPVCSVPVVHYIGHGCHMIYGCHVGMPEWCYVCGVTVSSHTCPNRCDLFCKYETKNDTNGRLVVASNCGCPLCPDCKPMRPCDLCCGCPMCKLVTR
jgi:hypothetical protein